MCIHDIFHDHDDHFDDDDNTITGVSDVHE